jgi:hypothetical protein
MNAQHQYQAPLKGQEGCQCDMCVCRRLSDKHPTLVKCAPLLGETLRLAYNALSRDGTLDPFVKAHMEYVLAKAGI